MKKLDFFTIFFNNDIEISLLKLQAYSFKFVDMSCVNKIYWVWCDIGTFDLHECISYLPTRFHDKVEIIYPKDLGIVIDSSGWWEQQAMKLLIHKKIKTKYTISLDAKNHFIRDVNYHTFFTIGKELPKKYIENKNLKFFIRKRLKNTLAYFNTDERLISNRTDILTPFIFETKYVLEMIDYIEEKESGSFFDFIVGTKLYLEYQIYDIFLKSKGYDNTYELSRNYISDPMLFIDDMHSRHECISKTIKNKDIVVFTLHRKILDTLHKQTINKVIKVYDIFYSDESILNFIKEDILKIS